MKEMTELEGFRNYCKNYLNKEINENDLKIIFENKRTIVYLYEPENKVFKFTKENDPIKKEKFYMAIENYKEFYKTLHHDVKISFYKIIELETFQNSYINIIEYAGESLHEIKEEKISEIIAYESAILLLPKLFVHLKVAHEKMFYLRDIKLLNICYDEKKKTLAFIDMEASEYNIKEGRVRQGTFEYYSPFHLDLFIKEQPINYETNDIFAFNIMIIRFLTNTNINEYFSYIREFSKYKITVKELVNIFLDLLNISRNDYGKIETHEKLHCIVEYHAFKVLISKIDEIKKFRPKNYLNLIMNNSIYIHELEKKLKDLEIEENKLKLNIPQRLMKSPIKFLQRLVSPSRKKEDMKI